MPRDDHSKTDGRASKPFSENNPTGVRIPPPLLYLVAILVGLGIHQFLSVPLFPVQGVLPWLGYPLLLAGLVLMLLTMREIFKVHSTIRPDKAASALVTRGPFRLSRNPIYLGMCLIQISIALSLNSFWILLMLVPSIEVLNKKVIVREERYLESAFGEAYREYCTRVRRWI